MHCNLLSFSKLLYFIFQMAKIHKKISEKSYHICPDKTKCRVRDTLSGDFKLFLLHFLMSSVVWLSGSIKIILLSILFLWGEKKSHVSIYHELKQTKSKDISGRVLVGMVSSYEQLESKAHRCWKVESFFSRPLAMFLPFCFVPFPSSLPPPLAPGLGFIRVPGFHGLFPCHVSTGT